MLGFEEYNDFPLYFVHVMHSQVKFLKLMLELFHLRLHLVENSKYPKRGRVVVQVSISASSTVNSLFEVGAFLVHANVDDSIA